MTDDDEPTMAEIAEKYKLDPIGDFERAMTDRECVTPLADHLLRVEGQLADPDYVVRIFADHRNGKATSVYGTEFLESLIAENTRLREGLQTIVDGVSREFRYDVAPRECEHGLEDYEDCELCIRDFAEKVLEVKPLAPGSSPRSPEE